MSHDEKAPQGPDFTEGVAVFALADGGMLLGHVGGDAVLLSRRGDELFAIGATCSHYGGPLAEGAVDGDTIRCPWHHACFSIRTGEALRAPALSPVATWQVERRADRAVVTQKVERDPLAPTYPTHTSRDNAVRRVVIVGAGAAGIAAAEMLRRCGFDGTVTVVDEDRDAPYDRPNLSKDFLAGNGAGRINFHRFLEFGQRFVQSPRLAQQLAAMNVRGAGKEPQPLIRGTVAGVSGVYAIRLLVKVVGLFVIFPGFGFFAFVI